MHKIILKMFDMYRSSIQFLKIVDVFCIMMLLLYWVQNLLGSQWNWLNFIKPLLDTFISISTCISDLSFNIWGAVFEVKYIIAIFLFIVVYLVFHIFYLLANLFQNLYETGRFWVKKTEENCLNWQLQNKQKKEKRIIQKYRFFVAIVPRARSMYGLGNIDIEEQCNIMNKFLMEKTGVVAQRFDKGFIYNFSKFQDIDNTLEIFFKLLRSKAPVDYQICVQLTNEDNLMNDKNLSYLISLNFTNKIYCLADFVWRYKDGEHKTYETSQLGVYQKENTTIEVHEIVDNKVDEKYESEIALKPLN